LAACVEKKNVLKKCQNTEHILNGVLDTAQRAFLHAGLQRLRTSFGNVGQLGLNRLVSLRINLGAKLLSDLQLHAT
jgi:hypothetical protein